MTDVTEHLQGDPGMHVKVLRAVNAAGFGLVTKVTSLQHAVTLLGKSRLEAILLSHAVKESLPTVAMSGFDSKRFWLVSLRRAALAANLASHLHPTTKDESFTAGLLQDMAIPVLAAVKEEDYRALWEEWNTNEEAWLHLLERETFGFDHAGIGALMAEVWELPKYLVNAISGHHDWNGETRAEPAVKLVSLIKVSNKADGLDRLLEKCLEEFDIEADKMNEMITKAFQDAEELSHSLN